MPKKEMSKNEKIFFIITIALLGILSFIIIFPLMKAVIGALILGYLLYPLYKKLRKIIRSKTITALLISIIVVLATILPLFFLINALSQDAQQVLLFSKQKIMEEELVENPCEGDTGIICNTINTVEEVASMRLVKSQLNNIITKAVSGIVNYMSNIILKIPKLIFNYFIAIFILYYLLKNGKEFSNYLKKHLPLKYEHKELAFKKISEVSNAVIFGQIAIALLQGILGTIGFLALGLPSPFFIGLLMAFSALIPMLGTGLVWFPISAGMILFGLIDADKTGIIKGIILLLYGAFVISTVDNFIRPKIIGERSHLHPVIVLLGVIGGIYLMGIVGLIAGPVILAIFQVFLEIYNKEKEVI